MPAPVPSANQRIADGKRRRAAVPRQSQIDLHPKDRSFDPMAVLLSSAKQRVGHLLPIKYARMKVSPFAFFRGAVSIMAADLARLPHSSLVVQLCDDAHVQNLGSFAAPDGKLVFDFNDFDETVPGPWEWDVKRMATSLVLAGRESGHGNARSNSVGLRDYVVLFEGGGPRDPLFLQIKQEVASAYSPFLAGAPFVTAAPGHHQGRRVAEGQRAIQPLSDFLLGWTTIGPHQYLVRQLNDHKGKVDLQRLRGSGLNSLALVAGELLARGHARSGDACGIRGYCGSGEKMVRALGAFATAYADQTEADYRAFLVAIKNGKIKVA